MIRSGTFIQSVALAAGLIVGALTPAWSAAAVTTQILLVGTYHFSNPGQDLHNVEAADVLNPQRQRELDDVVRSLAQFQPTRVAVEWPADIVSERYPKYRGGTLPQSRNEVVQLGFRLAQLRELDHVDGLDVPGRFPFEAVDTWAKKHGRSAEIESLMAMGANEVKRLSDLQQQTSIGGVLRDLNTAESIGRNHAFYPPLLSMGAGPEQPGVALLSAWYERNLAICARLLQTTRPGERVVVFFGQGHIYLLRQCLSEQPQVRLVDALEYLPGR